MEFNTIISVGLDLMSGLFIVFLTLGVLLLVYFYIADVTQTKHAIRRNYPVIGRFRYLFEKQGEFFRQYFFALDREEMPFNRAERSWVYRAAKNIDHTIAFGSTRNLKEPGSVHFLNCPFPTLEEDAVPAPPITIGEYCRHPYVAPSFFNISGMSYGALSKPAVKALSHGAKKAGCWLNSGEGGVSPYHLESGCDLVVQIGTAKYGVRDAEGMLNNDKLKTLADYEQVKMFEIKLSQGAKPGKGGILPAVKVSEEVAEIRGIPVGQASISPNGHPDIRSVQDLLDRIEQVREVTGKPVGIKFVMGSDKWLDELLEEVKLRGIESAPDFMTLDSADGGTGASPQSLMDYVGLPLSESLPLLVEKLQKQGMRQRIRIIASGKLITPSKVALALAVGADFVVSARGFMFSLGCIQAMQCNKDTCPTGVTTHNPRLQQGLDPINKAERVAHYHENIRHEVGVIAHSCGVKEPRQLEPQHVRVVITAGKSENLHEMGVNKPKV